MEIIVKINKTPEYTLRAIKAYKARQNEDPIKREQNKIRHREYMRQWRLKNKNKQTISETNNQRESKSA